METFTIAALSIIGILQIWSGLALYTKNFKSKVIFTLFPITSGAILLFIALNMAGYVVSI